MNKLSIIKQPASSKSQLALVLTIQQCLSGELSTNPMFSSAWMPLKKQTGSLHRCRHSKLLVNHVIKEVKITGV